MVIGNPFPLKANAGKSFQGSIVLGKGFVLTVEEAEALINKDPRNKDVLFPYLNGDDLNNDPLQRPSRWVINFFDWNEVKARTYSECFAILEQLVKPERMEQNDKGGKEKWWRFLRPRNELYNTISNLDQVMAIALTSKTVAITAIPTNQVFSHSLGIFSFADYYLFSCLQSTLHNIWAWSYGSSMKSDLRYTPSVCFETFPLPNHISEGQKAKLSDIGKEYNELRKNIMQTVQIGLTKVYSLFHDNRLQQITQKDCDLDEKIFEKMFGKNSLWLKRHLEKFQFLTYNDTVKRIEELRVLHQKMDAAALEAYNWSDIQLRHSFYEAEYLPENDRIRFTIHADSRKQVLKRLLKLNHDLHAIETSDISKLLVISNKNNILEDKTNSSTLF